MKIILEFFLIFGMIASAFFLGAQYGIYLARKEIKENTKQ